MEDATITLGSDLLLYNAEFQCVICKDCEYAVQPAAIPRHLKQRHKIYRKDRGDILEVIDSLPLVDPSLIQHHEYGAPVPHLAIMRGLYCTAEDCSYLCESLKRMQQHWAANHNKTVTPDVDWQPTLMQTFFRGTCTRYFRVRGDAEIGKALGQRTARSPRAIAPKEESSSSSYDETVVMPPPAYPDINLSDMSLFYHFLNFTSRTIHCGPEADDFWTARVPQIAIQNSYLMHGILASAAVHLACLHPTHDTLTRTKQIQLGTSHQNASLPGFRAALACADGPQTSLLLGFAKVLIIQKAGAMRCSGLHEHSCTWYPGCDNWHKIVDYLQFARSNTLMIHAIMRYPPMMAVQRFIPVLQDEQVPFDNPSIVPLDLLRMEILSTAPSPTRDILLETWQHFTNTFTILHHSEAPARQWEAVIYLSTVMSHDLIALIESHNVFAKIFLGYYAVVKGMLDSSWWLTDHATDIFAELKRHLDPKHSYLMEWAAKAVGVDWAD